MRQFSGGLTGKQLRRRERRSGGDDSLENRAILWRTGRDSLENFSVLRGVTPVIQCDYSSLQSTYSAPDRVIAGGRAGGEANVDGNRDAPREVGAGLDILVDSRAERGEGDAYSRGVESVPQRHRDAARDASRC